MTDTQNQEPQKKEVNSEVVLRKLQGKIALEKYPDGYIVTLRGRREIVWVRYEELKKIMQDFEDILEIKHKQP